MKLKEKLVAKFYVEGAKKMYRKLGVTLDKDGYPGYIDITKVGKL